MKTSDIVDFFIPEADIRKRHSIVVDAPADLVYETACNVDMTSITVIRFIFRLREIFMGAKNSVSVQEKITPLTLLNNGWEKLAQKQGHYFIAGTACRPWQADVVFSSVKPEQFSEYSKPDQVKIVWTLETEAMDTGQTRLSTETRVVATDDQARKKFQRYWRLAKFGIIAIRWILLPTIQREAMQKSATVKT